MCRGYHFLSKVCRHSLAGLRMFNHKPFFNGSCYILDSCLKEGAVTAFFFFFALTGEPRAIRGRLPG